MLGTPSTPGHQVGHLPTETNKANWDQKRSHFARRAFGVRTYSLAVEGAEPNARAGTMKFIAVVFKAIATYKASAAALNEPVIPVLDKRYGFDLLGR